MTVPRQAIGIAFDAAGNAALSLAVEDAAENQIVLDTGITSCPAAEIQEALRTLQANGIAARAVEFDDATVENAQSLALDTLNDLELRTFINRSVIGGGQLNKPMVSANMTSASTIRPPVVARSE